MVTFMQAKHNCRKGGVLFVVHVSSKKWKDVEVDEVPRKCLVSQ